MKVVFEAENLALHLRWILNLIATLRTSATVNSSEFCDTGLAFWRDKCRQNSFAILAPVAYDRVAAPASQAYVERAFYVCSDMYAGKRNRMSIDLKQRVFLRMN